MDFLSGLFQQQTTIWALVSVLIAWAALSALLALARVRSVLVAVRAARARLADLPDPAAFTRDYEMLSSDLLEIKLIGPR